MSVIAQLALLSMQAAQSGDAFPLLNFTNSINFTQNVTFTTSASQALLNATQPLVVTYASIVLSAVTDDDLGVLLPDPLLLAVPSSPAFIVLPFRADYRSRVLLAHLGRLAAAQHHRHAVSVFSPSAAATP